MPSQSTQVIDLTASSPPPTSIVLDSEDGSSRSSLAKPPRKKRKHRDSSKSRRSSPALKESQSTSDDLASRPPPSKRRKGEDSPHKNLSRNNTNDAKENLRRRSPSPQSDTLFFIDLKPNQENNKHTTPHVSLQDSSITNATSDRPLPNGEGVKASEKLLLPAHVSLLGRGSEHVEILPPPTDEDLHADFVEYLDYDDTRGAVRYWEEQKEEEAPRRIVCKKCGEEGYHIASECTVVICLTCGVRDEHPTRSCPITKVCFGCQMKGHVIQNCPNGGRNSTSQNSGNCTRCWSREHGSAECPTLWRIYEYVQQEERDDILQAREAVSHAKFGEGGEGYIASDEWCYNCGNSGHSGDDCQEAEFMQGNSGVSAFGSQNVMTGPFFDPTKEPGTSNSGKHKRPPREWEREGYDHVSASLAKWGAASVPDNVGQRGRRKESEKLARRMRQDEDADDVDDWFANPRNVKNRDSRGSNHSSRNDYSRHGGGQGSGPSPGSAPAIRFKVSTSSSSFNRKGGRGYHDDCPSQSSHTTRHHDSGSSSGSRSLLSRLGDQYDAGPRSSSRSERRQAERDRRERDRGNDGRNDRHRDHDRDSSGQRYSAKRRELDTPSSSSSRRRDDRDDSRSDNKKKDVGPRYKGGYSR